MIEWMPNIVTSPLAAAQTVLTKVAIAERFLELHGNPWGVSDLADIRTLLVGHAPTVEPGATWAPAARPLAVVSVIVTAHERRSAISRAGRRGPNRASRLPIVLGASPIQP